MKYLTVKEVSEKWNVTMRRIQKLCAENRIEGAIRFGHSWAIPYTAIKPADKRFCTNKKLDINIEHIVNNYGAYIYNLSFKLSGNSKDAEDLTQDTFIKAWQHIHDIKDIRAIKKWLRTICLNQFRMKLKKENKLKIIYTENLEDLERDSKMLKSPPPTLSDEVTVSEDVANLRNGCFFAMANKLTLNQRITFSLIDMLGLTINEVAKVLDISPKAVKGLLYRARMNLEVFFNNHCSILDINNSCQCLAWKDFVEQRSDLQTKTHAELEVLDYKKDDYTYNESKRQKILYYYKNLPEQKPNGEWFSNVINLINEFFKENVEKA